MTSRMSSQSPLRLLSIGFLIGVLCTFLMSCALTGTDHSGAHAHWGSLVRRQAADTGILKLGNPGPVVDLLQREEYVASYDRRNRLPHWVGEHLTAQSLQAGENVDRDRSNFKEDKDIPAIFRARLSDYTRSGYDRGHMAPAADAVYSQDAMDQTFFLTNMSPQVGIGFNRHYWAYLEGFVRDLTNNYTDVYVYTGPLFLPRNNDTGYIDIDQETAPTNANNPGYFMEYPLLGKIPNVAVPTHFFKIVLVSSGSDSDYLLGVFVLPNQSINSKTPLTDFQVQLSSVERVSGLQFFSEMDRNSFGELCSSYTCEL
ncbi:hypothetical protein BDB00DRAFT_809093 [Zychaea mexicana]|uniref:uncharacterized protein n=1 Tax=Zychaea mexicana TaxID=64656 RepID=UPI0022FF34DD|nr:uncharacterized protein BDB00DRAFT_809093 [Zychaea mexicana]KAI9496496.1 hypothetical protein BDB00DRAFT_809093 [Zychaea mexicana]